MVKLISARPVAEIHANTGVLIPAKGEVFEFPEQFADLIVRGGLATFAEEPGKAPAVEPPPAPKAPGK